MFFRVQVIGDSHLRGIYPREFSFEGNIQIECKPGSGMTFAKQVVDRIEESSGLRPHIFILAIGGNDLDKKVVEVPELVKKFVAIADVARSMNAVVMIMGQWPRPGARHGAVSYTTNVEYFEYLLRKQLPDNAWLWNWDKGLRVRAANFFRGDGVHCQPKWKKKVKRYLLSAILAAIRWHGRRSQ